MLTAFMKTACSAVSLLFDINLGCMILSLLHSLIADDVNCVIHAQVGLYCKIMSISFHVC
jgi:hypothetical protein